MTKRRKNPLDPLAYDTESRPFSPRRRPVKREEQIGVHVAGSYDRASVYAVQRAGLQGDSVGIVFVLDVTGLELLPDVDARIEAEMGTYAAGELLQDVEDTDDLDAVRDAIEQARDMWEQDDGSNSRPTTWLDAAFQALDRVARGGLPTALLGLDDDALATAIQHAEQTKQFPLEVWARVVDQGRVLTPIGLGRLVEVRALRPVRPDLWGEGEGDPQRFDEDFEEYPKDDPAAPQIFTDTEFFENSWAPRFVVLWSSGRRPDVAAYHGTDLVRARHAFPELPLVNPYGYTQD